jgi:hypothetical protein
MEIALLAWPRMMLGCALLAVAGCGPSVPYKTVPVSGKVTYDDGTPIGGPRVRVQFFPQVPAINAKEHPHAGSAELQPDGSFANVTTWHYADGVIPGPQKVVVQSLDKRQQPTGAVDPVYSSANDTPLTIEVKAGMSPIQLTVPKPAAGAGS